MTPKGKTVLEAATDALKDGPLHLRELGPRVIATKGVTLGGKTPLATIRKTLDRAPTIERTDRGTYALRSEVPEQPAAHGKRQAKPHPKPSAKSKKREKATA